LIDYVIITTDYLEIKKENNKMRIRKKLFIVFIPVVTLFMVNNLFAADTGYIFGVGFEPVDFTSSSIDDYYFKTQIPLTAEFGYNFSPHIATGMGLGFSRQSLTEIDYNHNGQRVKSQEDFDAISLLNIALNFRYYFIARNRKVISPYLAITMYNIWAFNSHDRKDFGENSAAEQDEYSNVHEKISDDRENEEKRNIEDAIDSMGFKAGFGSEFFVSENFGISGEFGIKSNFNNMVYKEYEYDIEEDGDSYTKTLLVKTKKELYESDSYIVLNLRYYF
jgi:hypothetical protein